MVGDFSDASRESGMENSTSSEEYLRMLERFAAFGARHAEVRRAGADYPVMSIPSLDGEAGFEPRYVISLEDARRGSTCGVADPRVHP